MAAGGLVVWTAVPSAVVADLSDAAADGAPWSVDAIADDVYRSKFSFLPEIIDNWLHNEGGLDGRDILDFGCGEGTTAIGMALAHPTSRVVGVDVQPGFEECGQLAAAQLGLRTLPSNLRFAVIERGEVAPPGHQFDVAYSWSVFEHIERALLPRILSRLRSSLRPGGRLFIQIAPLYYSAEGSHLFTWMPEPWGHLRHAGAEYRSRLEAATPDEAASLESMYSTLNRLTVADLLDDVDAAGFAVVEQYTTEDEHDAPADLLRIFHREVLTTNQVVLLLRPA